MTQESNTRIETMHKDSDRLNRCIRNKCFRETNARVESTKKKSKTMLDIMRSEDKAQIEVLKEESTWRSLREIGKDSHGSKSGRD